MNWRYKAVLQNVIAHCPFSDRLYYAVQRTMGDLRRDRFDPMEWITAGVEMLEWFRGAGFSIAGRRCLEVGTGRALGIPLVFWLAGAGETVTVDVNRYLTPVLVFATNRWLRSNAAAIEQKLSALDEDGGFRDRWERLLAFSGSLPLFLRLINVRYLAPGDARRLDFPAASFDLHFSYAVLEHVPPPVILDILREANRVLRPNGILMHTIDLSDHFWYSDKSISRINYLRFSPGEWQRWAGNKYMYQNRLRVQEYTQLFQQAGMSIERQSRTMDPASLQALQQGFPVHAQYGHLPLEELAIIATQVLARPAPSPPGDHADDATMFPRVSRQSC